MWLLFRKHFMHVRYILWELPLETKEDALSNKFHRDFRGKAQRDGLRAIRYREIGEELDQREYFLNLGRELLPEVHFMLDQKRNSLLHSSSSGERSRSATAISLPMRLMTATTYLRTEIAGMAL